MTTTLPEGFAQITVLENNFQGGKMFIRLQPFVLKGKVRHSCIISTRAAEALGRPSHVTLGINADRQVAIMADPTKKGIPVTGAQKPSPRIAGGALHAAGLPADIRISVALIGNALISERPE